MHPPPQALYHSCLFNKTWQPFVVLFISHCVTHTSGSLSKANLQNNKYMAVVVVVVVVIWCQGEVKEGGRYFGLPSNTSPAITHRLWPCKFVNNVHNVTSILNASCTLQIYTHIEFFFYFLDFIYWTFYVLRLAGVRRFVQCFFFFLCI